jgi:hypothetical protein
MYMAIILHITSYYIILHAHIKPNLDPNPKPNTKKVKYSKIKMKDHMKYLPTIPCAMKDKKAIIFMPFKTADKKPEKNKGQLSDGLHSIFF